MFTKSVLGWAVSNITSFESYTRDTNSTETVVEGLLSGLHRVAPSLNMMMKGERIPIDFEFETGSLNSSRGTELI